VALHGPKPRQEQNALYCPKTAYPTALARRYPQKRWMKNYFWWLVCVVALKSLTLKNIFEPVGYDHHPKTFGPIMCGAQVFSKRRLNP
jgi:hypothetical protein